MNRTPLYFAAENEMIDIFDLLISKGAQPICEYEENGHDSIGTFYQCFDCFPNPDHSICPQCAMICHRNHKITRCYTNHGYFCDCGAGQLSETHPCKLYNNDSISGSSSD